MSCLAWHCLSSVTLSSLSISIVWPRHSHPTFSTRGLSSIDLIRTSTPQDDISDSSVWSYSTPNMWSRMTPNNRNILSFVIKEVVLLCFASKPGYPAGNLYSLLQKLERKPDRGLRKALQFVTATLLQERHTNEYMQYFRLQLYYSLKRKLLFFKLYK